MTDIHRAARATLAPPAERHLEFDALFRSFFLGQTLAAPALGDDDEMRVQDADSGVFEPEISDEINEAGERCDGNGSPDAAPVHAGARP